MPGKVCELLPYQKIIYAHSQDSILRPGTPRIFVYLTDCIVVGGYFYSPALYFSTLAAYIEEHFRGRMIVDTPRPTCILILFKCANHYLKLFEEEHPMLRRELPYSLTRTSQLTTPIQRNCLLTGSCRH